MPAKAGIQVYYEVEPKKRLDSRVRGNDGWEIEFQSTNSEPLGLEPRVCQFSIKVSIALGAITIVISTGRR